MHQEATHTLRQDATWSRDHARSSDPATVIAHSVGALEGQYQVQINSLAQGQTSVSAPIADGTANLALNTVHIQVGTWRSNPSSFTSNPIWPRSSIVVGPGDTSLQSVRDKINAAAVGVLATVITDGTGSRLVLSSRQTGAANGFQVSTDGTDDPLQLQHQFAQDASGTVNGRPVHSASNTIENAAAGLSLQFQQLTRQPVSVSVGPDSQGIQRALADFSQSFNELRQRDPELSSALARVAPERQQELALWGLSWSGQALMQVDAQRLSAALQEGDLSQLADHMSGLLGHLDADTSAVTDWSRPGIDSPWLAQYLSLENSGT